MHRLERTLAGPPGDEFVSRADDRRHPGPGRLRLQASARSDARELFLVRGRFLVHFDSDRRLPDVLRGIRRGGAGLLTGPGRWCFWASSPWRLCFAELAARYPLSGGIYQWSRWIGSRAVGWMAGWVYLCGSVISLAAVALALQATLPQIAPVFQLIGDSARRARDQQERRAARAAC